MATSNDSKYANCYPRLNPVDAYRMHLAELLGPITGVDAAIIYPKLQWTQTLDKGDLMLPVPSLQIKGKKPIELAKEIEQKFPESDLVEKPIVKNTFLQFFFKPQPLVKTVIASILTQTEKFGLNQHHGLRDPKDPSKGRKRIIVEFSSPNIAKPFHAGHLRSTIIGGFLSKLFKSAGWDVIRINYLGDWGKQYGLLAEGYKQFGDEAQLQKDPINHLFEVYVKENQLKAPQDDEIKDIRAEIEAAKSRTDASAIETLQHRLDEKVAVSEDEKARRYFKSMEDGNAEALALWQKFRDLSITKYKQTYARLNIEYDVYSGESQIKHKSMEDVYKKLVETGVAQEDQGAIIVDFAKHGAKKLGKAIVVRKDGTPLYLTRDMGAIIERFDEYHFDKMIYVVASQQDLHLAQLFKVTELVGRKDIADRCQHVNFGMVLGMSTRKGTVKFLDDILRDVQEKMHEVMKKNQAKYDQVEQPEETADTLGITAVMVQDMSGKRINNYEFSLERMTSFEGDTGPYLQYAHARLCSITRKAGLPSGEVLLKSADLTLLTEPHAVRLVRVLAQWPDVVANALKTLEPTTILTYLFKMTHLLSSSYDVLKVVGSNPATMSARGALYESARQVLSNGMTMLGLSPVQRM